MEIITGRERRRHWSDEDKLRILEEAAALETSAAEVARRHDILPQQIYSWRRQFRVADHGSEETVSFLPVGLITDGAAPRRPKARRLSGSPIEIRLTNGRTLGVDPEMDTDSLRRLIRLVEGA